MRSKFIETAMLAALFSLGVAAQAAAPAKPAVSLPPSADLAYGLAAQQRGFGLKGEATIAWRAGASQISSRVR